MKSLVPLYNLLDVNREALTNAENLIRLLPDDIPIPECAPEPDGNISLDWIKSRHQTFSISVGDTNRLAFAWMDGKTSGSGIIDFDGVTFPMQIIDEIKRLEDLSNAHNDADQ